MNIGLIGYGAWGSHHASAISESGEFEIVAVCSRSETSRQTASEKLRVSTHADYRELLARADLDVVDIVLPTHLHREVASAALAAGKHVLLEKPMAATQADCRTLIDHARSTGKVLYIGHELRHSTQWGRMRGLIEEGSVGTAQYATIDIWRRPYRPGASGWRYDPQRVGSWTLEEPIHFFDLGCWWLREAGRPVSIFARGARRPSSPPGLWDNLSAIVSFESGAHLTVTQSLATAEHHMSAKVVGTTGAAVAFWDGEMDRTEHPLCSLKLIREGHLEHIPIAPSGELFELRAELRHFAAVIRGETAPAITPEEGALAVAVCEAAERSIQTGRVETL
jgi:myo-inositol 2-dehydrogenase / D-chiro-inositol 1-dehydrogenase